MTKKYPKYALERPNFGANYGVFAIFAKFLRQKFCVIGRVYLVGQGKSDQVSIVKNHDRDLATF